MAKAVFVFRTNIEDHNIALAQPREQLLGGDRLQLIARAEISGDDALHRCNGMLRHVPQGTKQRHDIRLDLVSQAINYALAVALRG